MSIFNKIDDFTMFVRTLLFFLSRKKYLMREYNMFKYVFKRLRLQKLMLKYSFILIYFHNHQQHEDLYQNFVWTWNNLFCKR